MQIFRSRGLRLLFITLAWIFAFCVTTALAQETVKVKGTKFVIITKYERFKVDDTEEHFLSQYETKDVSSDGRYITYKTGRSDTIKGNGPQYGYNKVVDREGGTYFTKYQGQVSTKKSAEGKPILTFKGTWSYIRGTEKYEGVQGGGTYKGMMIGKGIAYVDYEGEYVIKK